MIRCSHIFGPFKWGVNCFFPGPRWKFAHLRLIRITASKALCVARFEKVPVPTGSPSNSPLEPAQSQHW